MTEDRRTVVVIGSVSADLTAYAPRLPHPGETILGEDFTLLLGGKGANQAVAAARAGATTAFVGCVGEDPFKDMIVSALDAEGVDLTHLRTVAGPSGVAHIRVDASAQNDIVMIPLANSALDAAQIDTAVTALAPTAGVLLTQLETPSALTAHILRAARAEGILTILDPAPAASLPDEVWQLVDVVTPNETEATVLTGISVVDASSAHEAGRWFLDRGVRTAIITLAERGSCVVTSEGVTLIAPISVTAVDTTAAGDAYAGALGAALASGLPMEEAVHRATAAGALAVTRRGASQSLPTLQEIEALLA
ncbi:ribokinase [Microbacterium sp. NPDC055903]